jgi:hypothetical protein
MTKINNAMSWPQFAAAFLMNDLRGIAGGVPRAETARVVGVVARMCYDGRITRGDLRAWTREILIVKRRPNAAEARAAR